MSSQTAGTSDSFATQRLVESTTTTPGASLGSQFLESVIQSTDPTRSPASQRLDDFLSTKSLSDALRLWLGSAQFASKDQLVRKLNRDVAQIDDLLNEQINVILHHKAFQRLEASWRGIQYLTSRMDEEAEPNIKVKVLNLGWKELERDFERAMEFDQSELFRKIYDYEFGSPGGEPFSAMVGDYEIQPRVSKDHPFDDVGILTSLSQVAAAAFCPLLTNVSPAMFGLDDFTRLEHQLDHAHTFERLDYLKWRAFRDTEESRFVGLTLPRTLMRLPYEDDGSRVDQFCFREAVAGADHSKYLWGGAAYAMAGVMIRSFAESGWLADIRGVQRGVESGGLVPDLPAHCFTTDKMGIANKSSTDVKITDQLEKELSDLGFIPLCDCQDTEYSAFYSNQSTQKPKVYDRPAATANAKISAMLQHILCVSRFAHYIKVLGRDKTGAFSEPEKMQDILHRWIIKYVTADSEASPDVKAKFPLRDARVQVQPIPGKAGTYRCTMHLLPHYELEDMRASVRLVTEIIPQRGA